MKFDFSKSNDSDFRNKLQSDLDILMKNVLYITYQVDKLVKTQKEVEDNFKLQKQVDDYFEDDKEDIPEKEPEHTSHL